MGRPSKLTPERHRAIIERIASGLHPEVACKCEGVAGSTYRTWMGRGRKAEALEEAGHEVPESEEPFLTFATDVARAEAEFEAEALGEVRMAHDAVGNPMNAKWVMERRFADRWGSKVTVEVREEALGLVIDRLREGLDPATFARCVDVLTGEGGGSGEGDDADALDHPHPLH